MGCDNSRVTLSNEEIALRSQESILLFENQSVVANYMALCRYARGQRLNQLAFEEALDKMLVLKSNLGTSNTVKDFYSGFQVEPGVEVYDARLLKVLCVLLSLGTPNQKAEILFEIYDPEFRMSLDVVAVAEMSTDLIEISTRKVAVLVTDAQWKNSGQILNKQYIEQLIDQRPQANTAFKKLVLEGAQTVSKQEFIERMVRPEATGWMNTGGVRKILNGFSNERLKPKKHDKVSLTGGRPGLTTTQKTEKT